MKRFIGFFVFLTLLLFPLSSFAAMFVRTSTPDGIAEVSSKSGQLISDDLYIAGKKVHVFQPVDQDVFAIGQVVNLEEYVGDDLYAAGSQVWVGGRIPHGDIFLAGNTVTIDTDSAGKDVYAFARELTIHAVVQGNIWVASDHVTIARDSIIHGNVYVLGDTEPVIEKGERGAVVEGQIIHKSMPGKQFDREDRAGLVGWVRSVVALFVLSLVMVYLARALTARAIGTFGKQRGKALLTGILWLLLVVPACGLLLISLVGIPVAFGLLALTLLLGLAATGVAAAGVGRWVLTRLSRETNPELTWVHALTGAVVYKIIQLIPVVGGLFTLILFLLFFGAVLLSLFAMVKPYEQRGIVSEKK